MLYRWVGISSSDESFDVKDGIGWVECGLVFRWVSHQSCVGSVIDAVILKGEGDVAGGDSISLIIWYDFHFVS